MSSNNEIAPEYQRTMVAIDLGAESCRVSLLRWIDGCPHVQMVHRFANGPIQIGDALRWDLDAICTGVEEGLRRSAALAPEGIASIAADGWAVDYVRLTADGRAAADPFCYRDLRTIAAEEAVHKIISDENLFARNGLQPLRFNTVYQLYADGLAGIPAATPWVNLPEYVLYRLDGRRIAEYTNATHTGLVDVQTETWCPEIFQSLGLDISAAPELVAPGTDIGELRGPLAALPALQHTRLIAPACHDTASAIAGIGAADEDWAYISSGTWSLVGTVLDQPCTSTEAYQKHFTNFGGAGGRICFHRNVNGMWLLRQCMESWAEQGHSWSVPELITKAEGISIDTGLLDVDDPDLLLPGDMPARINRQRQAKSLKPIPEAPESAPQLASLIFHSLAARYAEVLNDLRKITQKPLKSLYIVGGGSRNALLNRLTEHATGIKVYCGHVESSTIGNFAMQLAVLRGAGRSGPFAADIARCAKALENAVMS